MANFQVAETLSGLNGRVRVKIVSPAQQRVLIARVIGTFVGTLKIRSRIAGGAMTDASVFTVGAATNANPTTPGIFGAILLANAVEAEVIFSAYTSGSARIEATELPIGA